MGIIGGAYYMSVVRLPDEKAVQGASRNSLPSAAPQASGSPAPPSARSSQILKCTDPEIGEFYTNAKDCENADLNNRLSHAETLKKVDYLSPNAKEARRDIRTGVNKKPDIRRVAKAVPDDLSISCKFSVGRALEIERMLSEADDARESIWRENYCRWLGELRDESCKVSRDYFYYGHLCPGWY